MEVEKTNQTFLFKIISSVISILLFAEPAWSCTHPACPVHQVVQLGDYILPLAAGYSCWFGCCHCCALLPDGNHTATERQRRESPSCAVGFTRASVARRQTHLVVVFSLLALLCRLFCWRANTEMGLLNRNEIRERNRQNDIEWKSRSVLKIGTWCTCNYNNAVCWKVDSTRAQQCENRKRWFQDNVSDGQLGRFCCGVQWFFEDPQLDNTVRGLTPLSLCVNILSGPAAKRKTEQPVTRGKCFSTCFWRQIASSCSLQQKSHYSQS